MAHHHHHHHGHDHSLPETFTSAFAIGILLNLGFVGVEALYGFWADSMALLADAGHNLSDVLGLALAWGGAVLTRRQPSPRFSYGLKKSTILAALEQCNNHRERTAQLLGISVRTLHYKMNRHCLQ